jgi:hypothetical protein
MHQGMEIGIYITHLPILSDMENKGDIENVPRK